MSIVPFPRDAAHTAGGTALSRRSRTPLDAAGSTCATRPCRRESPRRRPTAARPRRRGEPGQPLPTGGGRSAACPGTNRAAASACQAGGGTDFGRLQAPHVSRPSSPHAARPRQRREGSLSSVGGSAALPGTRRQASPRPGRAADGGGSSDFGPPRGSYAACPLRAVSAAAPPLPRGQGGWRRPGGAWYLSRRREPQPGSRRDKVNWKVYKGPWVGREKRGAEGRSLPGTPQGEAAAVLWDRGGRGGAAAADSPLPSPALAGPLR